MKKYEGSKADKVSDKKQAKKRDISISKWEGSKADNKMDKAAAKKAKMK